MSGKPGPGKLPIRLPPVYQLRVRRNTFMANEECNKVMSTVLTCWASAGVNSTACAALEEALRECMDGPGHKGAKKSSINHHLNRYLTKVPGAQKKK